MARRPSQRSKNKSTVPKRLLQSLAQDIVAMMETEEGYPLAMEIIDQLPEEVQALFIESLSSIHDPKLGKFFWLLTQEYDGEVQRAAQRCLEKFRLAGIEFEVPVKPTTTWPDECFFMAMASKTRLLGQVSLVMAWEKPSGNLDAKYFILCFNQDGIKDYFRVLDISKANFFAESQPAQVELVQLSFREAIYLLRSAYTQNLYHQKRPARGFLQYGDLLKRPVNLTEEEEARLFQRLGQSELRPDQVVNAYFVALRNCDWALMYNLLSPKSTARRRTRAEYVAAKVKKESKQPALFLKTTIVDQVVRKKTAEIKANLVSDEDEHLMITEYQFKLTRGDAGWLISGVRVLNQREVGPEDEENPLNYRVFCVVYDVGSFTKVESLLESLPEVETFTEFDYGVHYRWGQHPNPISEGINVSETIFAEFILTDEELIVFSREQLNLDSVCSLLEDRLAPKSISFKHQYYLDVTLVYAILSGEFNCFEEMLSELAEEEDEEAEPLYAATYEIEDLARVLKKLHTFNVVEFDTPEGVKVFYEFENLQTKEDGSQAGQGFIAEYRLTNDYLMVSAFGHDYLAIVCSELEKGIKKAIRLVDVQQREEDLSIFMAEGIEIPQEVMERLRKKELSRWLETEMPALHGMTPLEAKKSLEGRKLLWELFKSMKDLQKELIRKGLHPQLDYREYIKAIGLEKDGQVN
ncbi:MAG: hypothetical protein HPY81_07730 [Firmicutes bacterium]|nr:hypothetical protein [Bacillota bacterium]